MKYQTATSEAFMNTLELLTPFDLKGLKLRTEQMNMAVQLKIKPVSYLKFLMK